MTVLAFYYQFYVPFFYRRLLYIALLIVYFSLYTSKCRYRLSVSKEMKIIVINALTIVILLSAIAQSVITSKGYWTANNAPLQCHNVFISSYQWVHNPKQILVWTLTLYGFIWNLNPLNTSVYISWVLIR